MHVRTLYLAAFFALLVPTLAHTQLKQITTDKGASYLFADPITGHVHLLTAGVDANFDGIFQPDSGDVAPRWLVIDGATDQVVDSLTFTDFFNSFPIRPGLDFPNHLIYLPQLGRVRSFDFRTLKLVRDTVILGAFAAVSCDTVTGRLLLAERPGFAEQGYVWTFDPKTRDTLARVRTGINPSMSVVQQIDSGTMSYSTVSEGDFGKGNAVITNAVIGRDLYQRANHATLGGGAGWIELRGNRLFIVLGGPHELHILDAATCKELPYSPVVSTGQRQNGPRVLAFRGDSVVLVGTYNGEVMLVDASNGTVMDTVLMQGKVESMVVRDSLAFVAISGNVTTSLPDSVVEVVNLNTRTVIDTVVVGPSPVALMLANNGDIHVIGTSQSQRMWSTLDAATFAVKKRRTFTGTLDSPFRPVFDVATDSLYAVVSDTLRAASATNDSVVWRMVYAPSHHAGKLIGVSDCDPYLITHEAATLSSLPEYMHVVDRAGKLVARFKTSPRPFMAVRMPSDRPGAVRFYALDRGPSGSQVSQVDLFEFTPNIVTGDTLGDVANHMALGDGVVFVTLNGSHQIAAVNLATGAVTRRVSTGTTGFNGPRETLPLADGRLVVTTYNGDVRVVGSAGEMKAYATHGKAEGAVRLGTKIYVANPFNADYSADTMVTVFDATTLVASVERVTAASSGLEQNVPNPAAASTTIRFAVERAGPVRLTLYSLRGDAIASLVDQTMEPGSYNATFATGNLPSGTYLYRLTTGATTASRMMQVVR